MQILRSRLSRLGSARCLCLHEAWQTPLGGVGGYSESRYVQQARVRGGEILHAHTRSRRGIPVLLNPGLPLSSLDIFC
jgi:hypothetical protein